ncbi:hypothetical protein SAY86_027582 [Trapa natans]|uniref:Uncharacterized protein n=1 Tax=Trapa natans TaxID=22666 RepID=A0AAN7KUR8_TRANT|nr:hypothetical protein SAY86_027582 [Trapa natans]
MKNLMGLKQVTHSAPRTGNQKVSFYLHELKDQNGPNQNGKRWLRVACERNLLSTNVCYILPSLKVCDTWGDPFFLQRKRGHADACQSSVSAKVPRICLCCGHLKSKQMVILAEC